MTTTESDLMPGLKAKHKAMWATGDYPAVADEVIPALGPVLVDACGIGPGSRVLDVAAGSGNAAIPAAARGAEVVASDLTPELLDRGRADAERAGVKLAWDEADAEALPYGDSTFDVVMSCVGVMFAPHHQRSADELLRVAKPGGTIGLVSWTPEGFIGQMFGTMRPYVAAPPAGVQPPPLWGSEEHVRTLLGDRVEDVSAERRNLRVERFATPEAFRDFFKATYGPTIAAYRGIADDPAKVEALDRDLVELARRFGTFDDAPAAAAAAADAANAAADAAADAADDAADKKDTNGTGVMEAIGTGVMDWEYLLLTCRVR